MENATKALLIAGSVLIAILLIAMGVRIFNSATGTTESAQTAMDATETAIFNGKFTQYVGNNKSKSQVINLINAVIASNASYPDKPIKIFSPTPDIGVYTPTDNKITLTNMINKLKQGSYIVSTQDIDSDGIVRTYRITY